MFNPSALRERLSNANETADSITANAQWILFHKRHADEIAHEWSNAVKNDTNKLAQIYIANEVVQQSKLKRKGEFVLPFGKVLPSTLHTIFQQSDNNLKDRIVRVVNVWRDRAIFPPDMTKQIESSLQMVTGNNVPADLAQLVSDYQLLLKSNGEELKQVKERVLKTLKSLISDVEQMEGEDVYTAADAQKSQFQDDGDEVGYANDNLEPVPTKRHTSAEEDDEQPRYEEDNADAPAEKKQKVEVDPKLASFLASLAK